ncbi:MAG: hypothetical protein PHD21_03805, partial [Flavobacteriales bacterium]|nr:hypothetical protein [Flavobacteriales bacterium]
LDHMIRALDFANKDASPRGLPLIRKGDWNDTLDHIGPKGKGESLWCAMFLCYAMKKCFEVLELRGEKTVIERWQKAYDRIAKVLNEECWDGEWYLRATRDNGQVVGSHKDKQGKVFINTLSWPIISGIAPKDRADSSIATGIKYMENKTGIQICYPSYTEVDDTMGLISRCVPGKKENGAVFNHASAWFVMAALMNGDKETAWRIYKKMIPLYSSEAVSLDRYETEPYVYSEYVTSRDHPTEGQASHSWLTGSGVWMYRIAVDGIMGVKTSVAGVRFEPALPAEWNGASIKRSFRGKTLNVTYKAADVAGQTVTVNGEKVPATDWIDVTKYAPSTLEIEVTYPKSK